MMTKIEFRNYFYLLKNQDSGGRGIYNKSDEASKPDDWIKAGWANKADDWIKAGWAKRTDDWIKAGCEMISMAGWAMMADDWIKAGWANKADEERMAIVNVCEFWW